MTNATGEVLRVEFWDPAPLRAHPLHGFLPETDKESPEWHAFVDNLSGAGPERIPPIYVTPEGLVMDGMRRLQAAKQLQWERIAVVVRSEWEAASLMVESLVGQRHLSKGAKVYLILGVHREYVQSAESRRLSNLRRGVKTLEKALKAPKYTECTSGNGGGTDGTNGTYAELAERVGSSLILVKQASAIRRAFELTAKVEFEFQDGSRRTLRAHFEPQILDAEHPMGLGEVLKGIGWFVDENGKAKNQAPPERNSHLHYFERGLENFSKQGQHWTAFTAKERSYAEGVIGTAVKDWPLGLLEAVRDNVKAELAGRVKQKGE